MGGCPAGRGTAWHHGWMEVRAGSGGPVGQVHGRGATAAGTRSGITRGKLCAAGKRGPPHHTCAPGRSVVTTRQRKWSHRSPAERCRLPSCKSAKGDYPCFTVPLTLPFALCGSARGGKKSGSGEKGWKASSLLHPPDPPRALPGGLLGCRVPVRERTLDPSCPINPAGGS